MSCSAAGFGMLPRYTRVEEPHAETGGCSAGAHLAFSLSLVVSEPPALRDAPGRSFGGDPRRPRVTQITISEATAASPRGTSSATPPSPLFACDRAGCPSQFIPLPIVATDGRTRRRGIASPSAARELTTTRLCGPSTTSSRRAPGPVLRCPRRLPRDPIEDPFHAQVRQEELPLAFRDVGEREHLRTARRRQGHRRNGRTVAWC